jgi:putative transposase
MSRPYRIQAPHVFYHVTSRGDGKRKIFRQNNDHKKFLEYVLKAKEKYDFRLYAYVLLPNHYHLLVQTLQPNLAKIMHFINGVYTTYYNKVNKNVGHLFQGRYKSIIIEADSYFKALSRYIHLNPVKANIVKRPEDYKWSSYQGYVSKKGDPYIDKDQLEALLGMNERQYKSFVYDGGSGDENLFENLYAGSMLGSEAFIKANLTMLKEQVEGMDVSYKNDYKTLRAEDILDCVSGFYGIEKEDIRNSKDKQSEAKKDSIYMMKRMTGMTNKEIGELFGIGYTSVSKVCSRMEEEMARDEEVRGRVENQMSHVKV